MIQLETHPLLSSARWCLLWKTEGCCPSVACIAPPLGKTGDREKSVSNGVRPDLVPCLTF